MIKRSVFFLLVTTMLLGLTACGGTGAQNDGTSELQADGTVVLTTQNIEDYLIFEVEFNAGKTMQSVQMTGSDSAPDATTNMSIYGDVLVTTTSKRPVSYDMVSIQLKLVPQTEYWETLTTDAIQLTYEGEGSWKKDIQSSTAETVEEPTYEVVVVSVKGTAIAK